MQTSDLKEVIHGLPGDQFVLAWDAIEQIQDILFDSGGLAAIVLAYTLLRYQEREQSGQAQLVLVLDSSN